MTLTREFNAADDFDLNQLLLKPGGESVIWSVNDRDINGSVLRLRSAPREDHVAVYQVRVRHRDSQEADEFSLISFPLGTRMRFASWYDREMTDLSWLSLLPPVYSSLSPGFSNPEPKDCTKHFWQDVHPLHSNFHPGAAYEMRSRAVGGGSGHQAVYDSSGNLIRTGAGAGSADKGAPILGTLGPFRHRDRDVLPFVWAVQLDGNPVNPTWLSRNLDVPLIRYGEHMMQYQSVRPALWGPRPEIPPGICISTTQ